MRIGEVEKAYRINLVILYYTHHSIARRTNLTFGFLNDPLRKAANHKDACALEDINSRGS